MKKIAIIGAGFSGLGVCYHLLQRGYKVTLFDGKGVGGGASGIASGLLHPYPGERARLSWMGHEALKESYHLLKQVGAHAYKESGILRLALSEKQEKAFRKRAEEADDVEWWNAERCRTFAPGIHFLPGIFIRSGITVHASLYLKGLWKVCEAQGAHFEERNVSLSDLNSYDQVVLAAGGGIRDFEERKGLDLKWNKGQILVCKKPSYWKEEASIIGKGYIAMSESKERCFLGSTYEHVFESETPCMGTATELILKQATQYLPALAGFEVQDCLSSVRVACRKSYHPIQGKIRDNLYVMTAMGSRGLLYHSYLGKALAATMEGE